MRRLELVVWMVAAAYFVSLLLPWYVMIHKERGAAKPEPHSSVSDHADHITGGLAAAIKPASVSYDTAHQEGEAEPHGSVSDRAAHITGGLAAKPPSSSRASRTIAAGQPPLTRRPFNASACPRSVVLDGSCIHGNNKLRCAPVRDQGSTQHPSCACKRPCGAFAIKMRGAGGVVIREGLLMGVFGGGGTHARVRVCRRGFVCA